MCGGARWSAPCCSTSGHSPISLCPLCHRCGLGNWFILFGETRITAHTALAADSSNTSNAGEEKRDGSEGEGGGVPRAPPRRLCSGPSAQAGPGLVPRSQVPPAGWRWRKGRAHWGADPDDLSARESELERGAAQPGCGAPSSRIRGARATRGSPKPYRHHSDHGLSFSPPTSGTGGRSRAARRARGRGPPAAAAAAQPRGRLRGPHPRPAGRRLGPPDPAARADQGVPRAGSPPPPRIPRLLDQAARRRRPPAERSLESQQRGGLPARSSPPGLGYLDTARAP